MTKELELTAPLKKNELSINECIDSLETLFKHYAKDSEFNYQLNIKNSPFNQLKQHIFKINKTLAENTEPGEAMKCLNKIVESFNETSAGMYGLGEIVVANDLIYSFKKELDIIKATILKAEKDKNELAVYKLAYEWACNKIDGNPYYELLEESEKHIDFHKKLNAGEIKAGVIDE